MIDHLTYATAFTIIFLLLGVLIYWILGKLQ